MSAHLYGEADFPGLSPKKVPFKSASLSLVQREVRALCVTRGFTRTRLLVTSLRQKGRHI